MAIRFLLFLGLFANGSPIYAQFETQTNNAQITIKRYTGPGGLVEIPFHHAVSSALPERLIPTFAYLGHLIFKQEAFHATLRGKRRVKRGDGRRAKEGQTTLT